MAVVEEVQQDILQAPQFLVELAFQVRVTVEEMVGVDHITLVAEVVLEELVVMDPMNQTVVLVYQIVYWA
jgi:hypothetical protein